jgi:hypothetical protein
MPLYEQTLNDYYSFNVGEVHFISLNVRNPLSNSKAIIKWLEEDLVHFQKLNKWMIVLINKPIHLILNDFPRYELEFYKNLQDKFKDYNVDLVITSGGNHYQRTMPISDQNIFVFKNIENNHLKKCITVDDCDNKIILEPEAPIYISESFDTNLIGHEDTCSKNGTNFIFNEKN